MCKHFRPNGKRENELSEHWMHTCQSKYDSTTVRPNFSWTSLGVSIYEINEKEIQRPKKELNHGEKGLNRDL